MKRAFLLIMLSLYLSACSDGHRILNNMTFVRSIEKGDYMIATFTQANGVTRNLFWPVSEGRVLREGKEYDIKFTNDDAATGGDHIKHIEFSKEQAEE